MVERVGDAEPGVQLLAIESIAKEIKCVRRARAAPLRLLHSTL